MRGGAGAALLLAVALGSPTAPVAKPAASRVDAPRIETTAGAYLLYCGGCHGISGHSSDTAVPSLRGQVDAFLCLPEGREYVVRLPNVAFAPLGDAQLAALMNFVVGLGKTREGKGDPPYTAAEVGALRRKPLLGQPIAGYRRQLVMRLVETCGAPRSLLNYGATVPAAQQSGSRAPAR
jgi:mono/diheme cytochrome c family protein